MRSQLKKDEKIVGVFRLHWLYFMRPIIYAVFFLLAYLYLHYSFLIFIIIVFVAWFIYSLLEYSTSLFVVTNNRVIGEYGILSSNFDETPLFKINNVTYRKPIMGQIFDYGSVIIQSAATKGESGISFVAKPKLLRDIISGLIEKHEPIKTIEQPKVPEAKTNISNNTSVVDELIKLNDLKVKGIINEDEFIKAKEKILEKK